MQRIAPFILLMLAVTACTRDGPGAGTASGGTTASSPTPPRVAPSLPPGLPNSFDQDVSAADLPPPSLIPRGTAVDGTWLAGGGVQPAIVVAYETRKGDPFRRTHGFALWRHFDTAPPWRAVYGRTFPRRDGVLGIRASVADVTGDGADDVLLESSTGGSGTCATWIVVDVEAAAAVFERDLCDGRLEPSADPVGLLLTEAVFKRGDAHCCPSAIRTTVLTDDGTNGWRVASRDVAPL